MIDGNFRLNSVNQNNQIKRQYHRPKTLIKYKYICPCCGNLKLNIEVEEVLNSTYAITPDGEEGKCIKVEKGACDCNYILSCRKCGSWINFNDYQEMPYWENDWYGKTMEDVFEYEERMKKFGEEIKTIWSKL